MDIIGALIYRVGKVSPARHARLTWWRARARGDLAFELVERFVRPGDTVVDAGASRGLFSDRMARLVGPHGHVHLFEPETENVAWLQRLSSGRTTTTLHSVALSDREGTAELRIPRFGERVSYGMGTLGSAPVRAGTPVVIQHVRTTTLDLALRDEPRSIAFIKCDVEGHEQEFLRGAGETLRRDRPALLIEIEQRHRSTPVGTTFEHLLQLGYLGFAIKGDRLIPLGTFDLEGDQLRFLQEFTEFMPEGYVHNFFFVGPGTDLSDFLD